MVRLSFRANVRRELLLGFLLGLLLFGGGFSPSTSSSLDRNSPLSVHTAVLPPGASGQWKLLSPYVFVPLPAPQTATCSFPTDFLSLGNPKNTSVAANQRLSDVFANVTQIHKFCDALSESEATSKFNVTHSEVITEQIKETKASGTATLRATTNVTSQSISVLLFLQYGNHSDDDRLVLRLKGQALPLLPGAATALGRVRGGASLSEAPVSEADPSAHRQYVVFGHGTAPGFHSPFVTPFAVGRSRGREWLNTSTVFRDFAAALNLTTNSSFRAKQHRQERSLGECLWFGVFDVSEFPSDRQNGRDPTREGFLSNAVSGVLTSTCNVSLQFQVSGNHYDDEGEYITTLNIWMVFSICAGLWGYLCQHSAIRDSRSRTLRYSYLSCLWGLGFDFYFSIALISTALNYPTKAKATGAVALLSFIQFSIYGCRSYNLLVNAYALHPEPYSVLVRRILKRPFLTLYLWLMFVSVIASEFGGVLMRNPLGGMLFYSFFVPQIVHGVLEGDLNPIDIRFVAFSSLSKVIPLWYYQFSNERNYLHFQSTPVVGVFVTLWVTLQVLVLYVQGTKGSKAVIPPMFRPKKYSYAQLDDPRHREAILESPDCPICQMPMVEQRGSPTTATVPALPTNPSQTSGTGDAAVVSIPHEGRLRDAQGASHTVSLGNNVWVTPCNHYFHAECLMDWMEERPECPICRSRLPKP